MRAYLDDHPLAVDRQSLAGALRAAVEATDRAGRIIVEAVLDGRALTADDLANPSDDETPGELRLLSAEPRALVAGTLRDAAALLEAVTPEQARIARMVHAADLAGAMEQLKGILSSWQVVRDVAERGSRLTQIDMAEGGAIEGLARILGEISEAMQREDWSRLADLLEYDLCESAVAWRAMLEGAAASLERE